MLSFLVASLVMECNVCCVIATHNCINVSYDTAIHSNNTKCFEKEKYTCMLFT